MSLFWGRDGDMWEPEGGERRGIIPEKAVMWLGHYSMILRLQHARTAWIALLGAVVGWDIAEIPAGARTARDPWLARNWI